LKRIAAEVSMLPGVTLPAQMHDAVIQQALRRDVSVARVVREAILFYLNHHKQAQTSA
jgi:hypothetical protein